MKIYRMHWHRRDNPHVKGEATPLFDPAEAERTCRYHNHLYPDFKHEVVEVEFNEQAHSHLLLQ